MTRPLFILLLVLAVFQASAQHKNISYLCDPAEAYTVPSHFALGSMGGFFTYSEAIAQLDSMRAWYPNLISQKVQIGTSIEGRALYQVRISDNPDVLETEPQVLYTSLHHSQEPASLQQLIMYMYYLLENYATDPEVQYLVNTLDINFVPVVNPDGYVYNQQQNPSGGGTWRKNRRPAGLFYGVDLNRNYGYAFGYDELGSSSLSAHPWYRGDSAFSEPESAAMRAFIEAHDFKLALNWHSYGNYLIYPWNYETLLTSDSVPFEQFSRYLTLQSHYRYGTCDQTYGYNSNGDADDWAYGDLTNKGKILSFTAEIGSSADGFWPAAANITELCRQSLDMNLRFTRLTTKYALANDLGSEYLNTLQGQLPIEAYCLGLDVPATFTVSIIGVSPEITATGAAFSTGAMNLLTRYHDSISYSLSPSVTAGTHLKFLLQISNGAYTWTDTLVKIYAPIDTLFADPCNSFAQWDNSGWQATTEAYASSPSAFTESPGGNYSLYESASMEMLTAVDLSDYTNAVLQFKAKWSIEIAYDWMEVYASADGGSSWTPLCGKYSSYGSDDQSFQEPVYDGFISDWVMEEIPLDAYSGGPIKIKFTFNSDQTHNFDGAYVDDIFILASDQSSSINEHANCEQHFSVYPNPTGDKLHIDYEKPTTETMTILICDLAGRPVKEINSDASTSHGIAFSVEDLSPGLYMVRIASVQKFEVHLFAVVR